MTKRLTVHVMTTVKGGAGKTEMADVMEAALTLTGHRCDLHDFDDGNRGLVRRISADNVIPTDWTVGPSDVPMWIRKNAKDDGQHLIFDLGAGISSSDTSVLAFLHSTWRTLHDAGAKIVIYCIVSTNASVARFIERNVQLYGKFATIIIVRNNQDGSQSYPADIADRLEPKIELGHQAAGIQAVRLMRREPLSSVLLNPAPGYQLAGAIMAKRVRSLANQLAHVSIINPASIGGFDGPTGQVPPLMYVLSRASNATDKRILANAAIRKAEHALLAKDVTDADLLAAAKAFRQARKLWNV